MQAFVHIAFDFILLLGLETYFLYDHFCWDLPDIQSCTHTVAHKLFYSINVYQAVGMLY